MASLRDLYSASLLPKSAQTYSSGVNLWNHFRTQHGLPLLCTSSSHAAVSEIANFIRYAFNHGATGSGCSGNTIKLYLHAISWEHNRHRLRLPILDPFIKRLIRGCQNLSIAKYSEPLTAHRLCSFTSTSAGKSIISGPWSAQKDTWTALLLIWNLLLRVHECYSSQSSAGLLLQSLHFHWSDPPWFTLPHLPSAMHGVFQTPYQSTSHVPRLTQPRLRPLGTQNRFPSLHRDLYLSLLVKPPRIIAIC